MSPPLRKIALFLVAGSALWAAGPQGPRVYRNDALRVKAFEPPSGWHASPQPSYPRMLIEYTHPDGGRLTVAAQKVAPGATADSVAKGARQGLEKQGFQQLKLTADGPRTRLDARLDGGRRFLKQLYVVEGNLAYVVSMVAGSINEPQMARDFDSAARSLVIGGAEPRPSGPSEADAGVAP
jgi:hypothetical protein